MPNRCRTLVLKIINNKYQVILFLKFRELQLSHIDFLFFPLQFNWTWVLGFELIISLFIFIHHSYEPEIFQVCTYFLYVVPCKFKQISK